MVKQNVAGVLGACSHEREHGGLVGPANRGFTTSEVPCTHIAKKNTHT